MRNGGRRAFGSPPRRGANAELVPEKPAHLAARCFPRLLRIPDGHVFLVDPNLAAEGDPILDFFGRKEKLGDAVKPGGIGVHVRFRRRGRAVELEKVVQELDGLGYRYLLRIEDDPGQRPEFPAAVRAGFGDDGVDEGDFLLRPRPVLLAEPFGDGLGGERAELG